MFNLFKKRNKGNISKFRVTGMYCASCVMNIDGTLEETKGIFSSRSNYAKAETIVDYDPQIITPVRIIEIIKISGYKAILVRSE